jgi:hypothetical protein
MHGVSPALKALRLALVFEYLSCFATAYIALDELRGAAQPHCTIEKISNRASFFIKASILKDWQQQSGTSIVTFSNKKSVLGFYNRQESRQLSRPQQPKTLKSIYRKIIFTFLSVNR